jgi:hypothetical protein
MREESPAKEKGDLCGPPFLLSTSSGEKSLEFTLRACLRSEARKLKLEF